MVNESLGQVCWEETCQPRDLLSVLQEPIIQVTEQVVEEGKIDGLPVMQAYVGRGRLGGGSSATTSRRECIDLNFTHHTGCISINGFKTS